MATVKTRTIEGSEAGTLELSDEIFGVEPNPAVVRIAVNSFLANQRSGTHSTKTRGFVSGGGKKPWKQKHTGRARQGSIRATQWRGGAIAFGPSPRDYTYHLNKKVRQAAFRSVLSDLLRSERLIIVSEFNLSEPKTKKFAGILDALGVRGSALVLTGPDDSLLMRAARNIPYVDCQSAESPNIFDLLNHDYVIASAAVVKQLEGVHA